MGSIAGGVSESREVEGHRHGASPDPTGRNTRYYAAVGSTLLSTSMFSGMSGGGDF